MQHGPDMPSFHEADNSRSSRDGFSLEFSCLVTVQATQGSVPRAPGAWMAVWPDRFEGTIGGGHLEFQALADARHRLSLASVNREAAVVRYPLGPRLGQCCGGVVDLRFELVPAADWPALRERLTPRRWPVALFGAGHVGQALVRALAPLPFAIHWIDSREGLFPPDLPAHIVGEQSEPVQAAVSGLAPGSRVLAMSFSHAEDLEIVAACLRRQRERADLPFVGLIGSRTKAASFAHQLAERGFTPDEIAQVVCPIGIPGITGKEPAVIAASVAAQLLQTLPADLE